MLQHGFVRGRSTVSNLSVFTDYVINAMENGGQVDVIYTDIEKAFDRVDYDILLRKLGALGIHGDLLRWIRSYLTNRSQAVVLGGFGRIMFLCRLVCPRDRTWDLCFTTPIFVT